MKNELKIGARVRVSLYDVVTRIWHGDARNSDLFRRKEKLIFGTVEGVAGEFVAVRLDDGMAVAFLPETLEVVPAEAGVPAADVSSRGGARASSSKKKNPPTVCEDKLRKDGETYIEWLRRRREWEKSRLRLWTDACTMGRCAMSRIHLLDELIAEAEKYQQVLIS